MTPTSFTVHWQASSGNPAPVYVTQYREASTGPNGAFTSNPAGTTPALAQLVTGLKPATTYDVRVQASNIGGVNFTNIIQATTPAALTVTRTVQCSVEWGATAAESTNDTTVTNASGSIRDALGAVWTLAGGITVTRNGTSANAPTQALLLLYHSHYIYYANGLGYWFQWNGTAWVPTYDPRGAAPAESTNDTLLTSANGKIIDTNGLTWNLSGTSPFDVQLNGITDATAAGAQALLYHSHYVYRETTGGVWYRWTGSAWTQVEADPRIAIVHNGEARTFTDPNGITWGIVNGQVERNFTVDGTTANVVEIALVNGVVWHENTSSRWYYNSPNDSPPWLPSGGQLQSPLATVGTSSTRNYWDQPGGQGSVYNTPIGSGAIAGSASDLDTIDIARGWNGSSYTPGPVGVINTVDNYGCAIYTGKSSDPTIKFTSNNNGRSGTATDNATTITATMHVPVGAITPGPYPGDNPIVLHDPVNYPGRQYTFGGVQIAPPGIQPGQGPFTSQQGEWDDATSDQFGHDADTGLSGYNIGAGVITGWDVNPARPGYPDIQHALRYSTDGRLLKTNDNGDGYTLKPDSWPQHMQDYQGSGAPDFNIYRGNLKAGTTLFIPQGTTMPTGMSIYGQAMFRTMQRHPLLFRDQAGGGLHLTASQDADAQNPTYMAGLRQDLPKLVACLRPMRNQHQTGQSFATNPINGPGARLYAGSPPLAPIGGSVPTPTPVPVPTPSPGTILISPGNGSFTDSAGNVYSLDASNNAIENGAPIPSGAGTGAMAYYNGQVYGQDAASGSWYIWNQSTWISAAAPPTGTQTPTPTPVPVPTPTPTPTSTAAANRAAVLQLFATMAGSRTMSGQYVGYGDENPTSFQTITDIHTNTGKWLGLVGGSYWEDGRPDLTSDYTRFNKVALDYWKAGGLVIVNIYTPDPTALANSSNYDNMTVSGTRENANLLTIINSMGDGLAVLRANGVVAILRPWLEMNGYWFSWGNVTLGNNAKLTDAQYVAMWRYAWNHLTNTRGLDNLVWCWSPNAGLNNYPAAGRYPGSSYVDMVGLDCYADDLSGLVSDYNAMLAYGKPFCLAEFGSGGARGGNTNYDERNLINQISTYLPKTVFWQQWYDANSSGPGWGLAEVKYAKEALALPRVYNRGDFTLSVPTSTPTSSKARITAPLTGTVTPGAWVAKDITVAGVQLPCGKPIHLEYLLPAQFDATKVYPILLWAPPTFEGNDWYQRGKNISGYDAD